MDEKRQLRQLKRDLKRAGNRKKRRYLKDLVGSGRQAVTAHPEFSRVNTVLSNLKTAISGTYHHFKFASLSKTLVAT